MLMAALVTSFLLSTLRHQLIDIPITNKNTTVQKNPQQQI